MDLIFAEASPPGRGGVSVIRLSGDGALAVLQKLAGPVREPRRAVLRTLRDGDEILDQALVIWFEAGRSFTGEEVVELQLHGAPVIVRRVMATLQAEGCRVAEAGEFSRRAFLNGRMDLVEIEGLGDLLAAETEAQRKLAMQNANGVLGQKVEGWRRSLIRAGAMVEVSIDFADEDVPDEVPREVFEITQQLWEELDRESRGFAAAERLRKGFEVAVIGPPNAGKSSLINRIARREVALVSDIAGTTRDIIELQTDLKGLAVTFLDTAGLRDSDDAIEAMGVELAQRRARNADLRLHVSDDGAVDADLWTDGDLLVYSKSDLRDADFDYGVSARTGQGIDALLDRVYDELAAKTAGAGQVAHQRQMDAIMTAKNALTGLEDMPAEILAESIRQANTSLDRLVGRIGAEDYLDVIFSSFCIGK